MLKLVMRSRWHSIVAICLFSASLFFFPILFLLANSLVAMVTLVHGVKEGFFVALTTIGLAIILQFSINLDNLYLMLIVAWLPLILISQLIKQTNNLATIFMCFIILAVFCLVTIYLMTDFEPKKFWQDWLQNILLPQLKNQNIVDTSTLTIISSNQDKIIANLNSTIVLAIVIVNLMSIFLARFWQARLLNSDGFANEFKQLTMSKTLASILILLIGLSYIEQFGLLADLRASMILLFSLQGLAVIHYWISYKNLPKFTIAITYLLLFLVPIANLLISAVGALDNWLKFRVKLS